jgi:hypothetical protein
MSDASARRTSGLLHRFNSLPRPGRWLVLAVLGLGAYFLVVEPLIDATVEASGRADAMASQVRTVRAMGERAQGDQQLIALGSRLHGPVELPGPRSERATALNRAVDRAMREAGITGVRTQTTEQNLADGPATRHFGGRGSLVKLVSTLSFDASPEAFSTVLGALEADPDVAGVTRVSVRRADDGGRQVSATLTVEAWALSSTARAGGAS